MLATMKTLNYANQWLDFGWLDEAFLADQQAQFDEGTDPYTEHYRYAAFRRVLHTNTALNDDAIGSYVDLAQRDPDVTMGESAFIQLLWWRGLSMQQFERLALAPAFPTRAVSSVLERVRGRFNQQTQS